MQLRYRVGLMTLCTIPAVLSALIAGSAPASASGGSCSGNAPWDYDHACVEVNGTGLNITYAISSACTQGQPGGNPNQYGHVEMTGPNNRFIGNGPSGWAQDGSCFPSFTWWPYHNEPKGYYCTTLWIKTGANSWADEGKPCLDVHSLGARPLTS